MSFSKKLFFMSAFIIVLPVIATFYIANITNRNILSNEFKRLNAMAITNISEKIDDVVKAIDAGVSSIYYNKDIYYTLFKYSDITLEQYRHNMMHNYEMLDEYHNITYKLRSNSYLNSMLKEPLSMIITSHGISFSNRQISMDDNDVSAFISFMEKNNSDKLWFSSKNSDEGILFKEQIQSSLLCLVKKVYDPTGEIIIGYAAAAVNEAIIQDCFDEYLAENESGCLYLVNAQGNCVSQKGASCSAEISSISSDVLKRVKNNLYETYCPPENKQNLMIAYNTIETNGWMVIYTIPIPSIMPNMVTFNKTMLTTIVIVIIVTIILAWILGRKMSENIRILSNTMLKCVKNNVMEKTSIRSNDEIGYLTNCYNLMIDRVLEGRRLLVEEHEKKLDAQRKFLQSQINAHFLYNTLNSIRVLGSLGRTSEISNLTTALIKLLRTTIDNSNDVISLHEEMENLINYIYIQEIRYADIFKVYYDISEDVGNYNIPKLLLQPIVENAIFHGMRDKESGGRIDIIARKIENGVLLIKICDNGMGTAENVLDHLAYGNCTQGKVGLRNVDDRIKLYFGLDYGVSLSNNYPCGLCVEIRIPEP